jgi:hypothetical protein
MFKRMFNSLSISYLKRSDAEDKMARANIQFEKIQGIKKIVYCKSCGKRIEVNNFNRMLCERCGYREGRSSHTAKA